MVRIDSVQQSNKIDCSLLAMTAFKKNQTTIRYWSDSTFSCLEFSCICLFLEKIDRGFRFLHLGPGIRVPDPGTRTPGPRTPGPGPRVPDPGSRIPGPGFQNPPVHFRYKSKLEKLYRFVSSNSFGMSCTFLACLHGCIFEIWFFF